MRYTAIPFLLTTLLMLASLQGISRQSVISEFTKVVDFLPPPPNAAAITKAGFFNINKNTGAPNVSIPVYTVKGKYLTVNVGLNYATNGIKVDEIASRNGMGWALVAGGVISRVIRGGRDEAVPRKYPWEPIATSWATYNYMKGVSSSTNYVGTDAEPDLFSFNFNGHAGSFVFDGGMNAVQLPAGNLKIEKDFATNAAWNFKITAADGIIYYFGGSQATEKTKRETTCGKNFDDYFPTAWYLTKMEHPTGEIIQFNYTFLEYTYDTGLSETRELITLSEESGTGNPCSIGSSPQLNVNTCTNYTRTRGYVLNSISSNYEELNFSYTGRNDCADYLMTDITVKNKIQTINTTTSFTFIYNYYNTVPYLSKVRQNPTDGAAPITHQFIYNDPGARPARLSKSQDHWGFYNGKSNTTLLPFLTELQPGSFTYPSYFTSANADRAADFEYASKGMLVKVLYPTGGADSILYEPNGSTTLPATNGAKTYYTCQINGTNHHDPVYKTIPFTLLTSQVVRLDIDILSATPDWDPLHQLGTVNITTSGNPNVFYEVFQPGTSTVRTMFLSSGSYNLILRANGSEITTRTKITYHSASASITPNQGAPGVRVKGLLSGNPGEIPVYKKYYYAYIDNLGGTSLNAGFPPKYLKNYFSKQQSIFSPEASQVYLKQCVFEHTVLYANSIRNLFNYTSSAVSYAAVVEGIGDNFEGGAIETIYGISWDQMGTAEWNNDILDAPFTNGSIFYNGKVRKETIYRKEANNVLLPVKKIENIYKDDERDYKAIEGYVVFKKAGSIVEADTNCISTTVGPYTNFSCWILLQEALECFDMTRYIVHAPWIYVDSVKETTYAQDGTGILSVVTKSWYDNIVHKQLTRSEVRNSKNELKTTTLKYPSDFAVTGNVYDQMVTRNMIAAPVYKKLEDPAGQLTENKTNYSVWNTSMLLPASFQSAIKNNLPEIDGEIIAYDSKGNITEYKGKDGVVNSVIWGYDYCYPVVKVIGATYSQILAQLTVSIATLQTLTGNTLLTELNRIRQNLPQAIVISYSYAPNIGVTTIVNEKNVASYYEYDGFNRLKIVRDKDNNIIKKNEYNYAGSDENVMMTLFFNDQVSSEFTCQNCPSGTKGSTITYGTQSGKFFSTISKSDANAKALAYVNTNGQKYVNLYGFCDNTICSGQGYALIDCACELGQISPVSCSDNPDGTWNQTYRYKWSNNTFSTDTYTRVLQPCTLPQFKKVGCTCYAGIKMYRSSTQNPNGTWTCVYYYRYGDNTISPDYTETTTGPCGLPE